MLNRTVTRNATSFVNLSSRQLTVAVVGVTPGGRSDEGSDVVRHFCKNDVPISVLAVGLFQKNFDDINRLVDPSTPMKKSPTGRNSEFIPLLHSARNASVPVKAVGRHNSHTFVRTSWMVWDHPRETVRGLYELMTMSLSRKLLTPQGHRYLEAFAPHIAHQIYTEPAKFAVFSLLKDLKAKHGSAAILALPVHLVDPAVAILSQVSKVSDEDVNLLLAKGVTLWPLIILVWVMIPIISMTVIVRGVYRYLHSSYNQLGRFEDPAHTEKVQGVLGTRWYRDIRRE